MHSRWSNRTLWFGDLRIEQLRRDCDFDITPWPAVE